MFMVTSLREDVGARDFAILDYFRWSPHPQVPRSVFKKPPQCTASQPAGPTASAPSHCSTCHLR